MKVTGGNGMVKIKVKKEFTKREFIKYLLEQDDIEVDLENYHIEYHEGIRTDVIKPEISGKFPISFNHDTKMIELYVEEEVTKYSEIPNLVELYDLETGKGPETLMHQKALVNNFIENEAVIALYAMNDDYTLALLWTREGGMVE